MWYLFGAFIVFSIAASLLAPKTKNNNKPSALGEFNFPTASEGRSLPVIVGTVKCASPNVTWYGDLGTLEMTEKVKTGPCSSTRVSKGFKYYIGMMLSICMGPVDELSEIWVGDKKAWAGSVKLPGNGQKTTVYINSPDLFGGSSSGGGIQGMMSFYFGTPTQVQNNYYASQVGNTSNQSFRQYFYGASTAYWNELVSRVGFTTTQVPAFRHVCYAVLEQMYIGTGTNLEAVSFVLKRIPNKLGLGAIGQDANPAEIIYELLTDTMWGLGITPSWIETTTFLAVGTTLKSEGAGLSMQFDSQTGTEDLIEEILRHVDGAIYTDLTTGKITLKLIRNDYVISDLPIIDTSNAIKVDFSRQAWPETFNEVKVSFIDRANNFQEKVTQAVDVANYYVQNGNLISQTMDFKGFSSAKPATSAAVRVLKVLANPLAKVRIECNRQVGRLRPGECFILNWEPLGIYNQVQRIVKVDYGDFEDGVIVIDAIEDIFGTPSVVFTPPLTTNWSPPISGVPPKIVYQGVLENPYFWQGTNRWVSVCAARASASANQYEVWTDAESPNYYKQTQQISQFTPVGILLTPYTKGQVIDTVGFTVTNLSDMNILTSATSADQLYGNSILLIGNELMAWKSITNNGDGTFTISDVWRGILDTVPLDHAAGAIVYFVTAGVGQTSIDKYDTDLSFRIKLLPSNSIGTQADATIMTITTDSRAWKPYPPAKLRVNGNSYNSIIAGGLDALVTWAHRNRVTQGRTTILTQNDTSTSSIEGTYTIKAYVDNTLVSSITGFTGNTFTFNWSWVVPFLGNNPLPQCKVEVIAVNESYVQVPHTIEWGYAGYGLEYGKKYGGGQ